MVNIMYFSLAVHFISNQIKNVRQKTKMLLGWNRHKFKHNEK